MKPGLDSPHPGASPAGAPRGRSPRWATVRGAFATLVLVVCLAAAGYGATLPSKLEPEEARALPNGSRYVSDRNPFDLSAHARRELERAVAAVRGRSRPGR